MDILAIPQATIRWLNEHPSLRDELAKNILDISKIPGLATSVVSAGPIRVAASDYTGLVAIWNTEYLASTGSDNWGIIKISGECGLLSQEYILSNVFERQLSVIDRRLNDLILPDPYIHRGHGKNIHTCIAGGNDDARKLSIGYFDGSVDVDQAKRKLIFCVGPSPEGKNLDSAFKRLTNVIRNSAIHFPKFIADSEIIINTSAQRPTLQNLSLNNFSKIYNTINPSPAIAPSVSDGTTLIEPVSSPLKYATALLTYDEWREPDSPLTNEQREVLESDNLLKQPLRIAGPAGSGKTLLLQLIAIKLLRKAKNTHTPCTALYVVHNAAMVDMVWDRFDTLGADDLLDHTSPQHFVITTLSDFSRSRLGSEDLPIIDKDAEQTKAFQRDCALMGLKEALGEARGLNKSNAPLLTQVSSHKELMSIFSDLLVYEFGVAIKGHQLTNDPQKYIQSEIPLSRLHKELTTLERTVVFKSFRNYHKTVFEDLGVLDTDDLAISLVAQLRTPLWDMRRRNEGVDYLFVDETHLFNENERRIFALLTKPPTPHLPIALALDQAQDLQGATVSGFGRLGIDKIQDTRLSQVPRCTKSILELAFHFIQQTTDLFSAEFPDFTASSKSIVPDNPPLTSPPVIKRGGTGEGLGTYVNKQIRDIRSGHIRKIGVIVYGEKHWDDIRRALVRNSDSTVILSRRGDLVDDSRPVTVVSKPDIIGGQEFDAVLVVGVENGIVPPRVDSASGLSATFEQQALRSLYLTITRAKYRLVFINSLLAAPSPLLESSINAGLLTIAN